MIPADSYQVQKVGNEKTGFVTKVVVNSNEQVKDSQMQNASTKESKKPSGDGEAKLSKKERQKLKRKAKKEAAKERKRLKKAQEGEEGKVADSKSSDSDTAKKPAETQDRTEPTVDESLQQEIEQLQTTWSISAVGVTLHATLCTGLHSLKYTYPTPIQSSTLSAAILGRRDIVGAAPTGSGKTLSFGLPILQYLLEEGDKQENQEAPREKLPLQALILTPTRELAMQVTEELKRASCNKIPIGTIVGGFAEVKQKRVLEKTRPPIIVATPGRLWELVSSFFCCCWQCMLACAAGFINEEKNITWFRLLELKCNKFMKLHPFARQSERIRNNSSFFDRNFCVYSFLIFNLTTYLFLSLNHIHFRCQATITLISMSSLNFASSLLMKLIA